MATDKEVSRRLERVYGINLSRYNEMLAEQNGVCAICGKEPTDRRLHVDHCHKFRYLPVESTKVGPGQWTANHGHVFGGGKTKSEAIREVRQKLKVLSIRGLACFLCNRAIRVWNDNADNMAAASRYIKMHEAVKTFFNITTKKQGDSNGK